MVHELRGARGRIAADDLQPAFKMLARVSRIQAQMIQSWDVLSTLDPGRLPGLSAPARAGLRLPVAPVPPGRVPARQPAAGDARRAPAHAGGARRARGRAGAAEPLRRGDPASGTARLRDRAGLRRARLEPLAPAASRACSTAWAAVYRDAGHNWDLYELAEELVDLEDWFRQWRFRHVTTVERIIGHKTGTGGSSGVSYLKRALDVCCFPELWQVRTEL